MIDLIGIGLIAAAMACGLYGCQKEEQQTQRELNKEMIEKGIYRNTNGDWISIAALKGKDSKE